MNTKQKINLISRLRKNQVTEDKIDAILKLDKKSLDRLSSISNNEKFISAVQEYLNETFDNPYGYYLENLTKRRYELLESEYKEGLEIIKSAFHNFGARCAMNAICLEVPKKYGNNIVGARLISMAKSEMIAVYALNVLNNQTLNELGVVIPIVELIIGSLNKEECLNQIKVALTDEEKHEKCKNAINSITEPLRRIVITIPFHREEAIELLNVFQEILNEPMITPTELNAFNKKNKPARRILVPKKK